MVFAFLELGIGVLGVLSPFGFVLAESIYGSFYPSLVDNFAGLVLVRFLFVSLLILGPSFLMGGTLPLLCHQYVLSERKISLSVGLLYGLNTLGAAVGCALCGFYLIGFIGVNKTIWLGGALNILIWLVVSRLKVSKKELSRNDKISREAAEKITFSPKPSIVKSYIFIISFLFFRPGE
jgi:spermidine synthase